MPDSWSTYNFLDFVDVNPTVSLKSGCSYSFVEMKDLSNDKKFVCPSTMRKLTGGARFQEKDTLFARITPCLENGKICQVKSLQNNIGFGSTEFLVFRGKENISDSDFVFYLSRYPIVRKFAEQNMIGTSGRQRVAKDAFANLELELPSLPIQQRIASILGVLDDKIENNLAMNHTLEQMAMAYFNEYCTSKNGELPDDWIEMKVGDLVETVSLTYNFKNKAKVIFLNTSDILDGFVLHENYSEIKGLPG
ncbi:MAG: hypothetical protein A2275_17050 [Bacteroidetes bacterium RIFOXYA12_FULL_35_11]|nr:MAG: hypothetical protein A2X01_18185 [Bacteroidetes bacterium GWF2_35_48]OFY83397.1 MAG: hypothetical protein A2275_17050 [Bacteroidetes bacterium RIFOXYA12_FULL_35_11]OFY95324.1 MAG: hypothetical protein A2309_13195 [Bacteroidetes bacterium RIFOXYB2_FULL_35_7]OFZ01684.1 MAG: hypothetical protein A2491_01515 [Bacteroidetes bacterium RIFOXYC12_FULL_35_7]HBX51691.1 hypothetical protein [Bacteroidales bacterium]